MSADPCGSGSTALFLTLKVITVQVYLSAILYGSHYAIFEEIRRLLNL